MAAKIGPSMKFSLTLIDKLLNDKKFEQLTEDKQRVKRALKIAGIVWAKLLKKSKNFLVEEKKRNGKSESSAERALFTGNAHLKNRDFQKALDSYSQAVVFAPTKQINLLLAKAYEGRSLIHLANQDYQSSIDDVDRALEMIPDSENYLIYQLKAKKLLCLVCLKQNSGAKKILQQLADDKDFVKLVGAETVTQYINDFKVLNENKDNSINDKGYEEVCKNQKVQIKYAKYAGRHVIATEDIEKNEVILREEAVAHCLAIKCFLKVCSHCCKSVENKFIPCENCSQVVFCDRICRRLAWLKYHRFECQIAHLFVDFTPYPAIAFRTVLLLGPNNCINLSKKRLDKITGVSVEALMSYKAACSLLAHRDQQSSKLFIFATVKAIEMTCILYHAKLLQSKKDLRIFGFGKTLEKMCSILIKHQLRCFVNNYCVVHRGEEKKTQVGNVVVLFGSCFNHSCDPNANWEVSDKRISIIANKIIKAGEEVTISYGPVKSLHTLQNRQKTLRQSYFFSCQCSACLEDKQLVNEVAAQQMFDEVLNCQQK